MLFAATDISHLLANKLVSHSDKNSLANLLFIAVAGYLLMTGGCFVIVIGRSLNGWGICIPKK
jgi:hypothetical protein